MSDTAGSDGGDCKLALVVGGFADDPAAGAGTEVVKDRYHRFCYIFHSAATGETVKESGSAYGTVYAMARGPLSYKAHIDWLVTISCRGAGCAAVAVQGPGHPEKISGPMSISVKNTISGAVSVEGIFTADMDMASLKKKTDGTKSGSTTGGNVGVSAGGYVSGELHTDDSEETSQQTEEQDPSIREHVVWHAPVWEWVCTKKPARQDFVVPPLEPVGTPEPPPTPAPGGQAPTPGSGPTPSGPARQTPDHSSRPTSGQKVGAVMLGATTATVGLLAWLLVPATSHGHAKGANNSASARAGYAQPSFDSFSAAITDPAMSSMVGLPLATPPRSQRNAASAWAATQGGAQAAKAIQNDGVSSGVQATFAAPGVNPDNSSTFATGQFGVLRVEQWTFTADNGASSAFDTTLGLVRVQLGPGAQEQPQAAGDKGSALLTVAEPGHAHTGDVTSVTLSGDTVVEQSATCNACDEGALKQMATKQAIIARALTAAPGGRPSVLKGVSYRVEDVGFQSQGSCARLATKRYVLDNGSQLAGLDATGQIDGPNGGTFAEVVGAEGTFTHAFLESSCGVTWKWSLVSVGGIAAVGAAPGANQPSPNPPINGPNASASQPAATSAVSTTTASYNFGPPRNASGTFANGQGGCPNFPPSFTDAAFVFSEPAPGRFRIFQRDTGDDTQGAINPAGQFDVSSSTERYVGRIQANRATAKYQQTLNGCTESYDATFTFT